MRFIHTSDWHLGRLFFGESLTGEQAALLQEFVALVKDQQPDAVLIAGDVYDRGVPPAEAVSLLDEVLGRLALDCRVPVLMIAGNHDSGARLAFGQRFFGQNGLHVCSAVAPALVRLADRWGPVDFVLAPFAETAAVRLEFGEATVNEPDSAMQQRMSSMRHLEAHSPRRVAIAHAFLTGGQTSESERPLSVGGTGAVSAAAFAGFQYVAMGHLHRPQQMEAGRLSYSGSLMKYSFEEADHKKGVYLVELDQVGALRQEFIPLPAGRDVRVVSGLFNDIMQGPAAGERADDYLSFLLLDEAPVIQAVHRLRTIYPKTMEINYRYQQATLSLAGQRPDHRALSSMDLFESFVDWSTQKPLTELQRRTMAPFLAPADADGEGRQG